MEPYVPPPPTSAAFPGCPPDALELLDGLLRYDPRQRLTAAEALAHPYFRNPPEPTPPGRLPRPGAGRAGRRADLAGARLPPPPSVSLGPPGAAGGGPGGEGLSSIAAAAAARVARGGGRSSFPPGGGGSAGDEGDESLGGSGLLSAAAAGAPRTVGPSRMGPPPPVTMARPATVGGVGASHDVTMRSAGGTDFGGFGATPGWHGGGSAVPMSTGGSGPAAIPFRLDEAYPTTLRKVSPLHILASSAPRHAFAVPRTAAS